MQHIMPFLLLAMLAGCEQKTEPQAASTPTAEAEQVQATVDIGSTCDPAQMRQAKNTISTTPLEQAQRLWCFINDDAPAKHAAVIDSVLKNDAQFDEIFKPLGKEVNRAIYKFHGTPTFAPYEPCLKAAHALDEIARFGRNGDGHSDEAYALRHPYVDNKKLCEQALAN